jgi:hypothetical protein
VAFGFDDVPDDVDVEVGVLVGELEADEREVPDDVEDGEEIEDGEVKEEAMIIFVLLTMMYNLINELQ